MLDPATAAQVLDRGPATAARSRDGGYTSTAPDAAYAPSDDAVDNTGRPAVRIALGIAGPQLGSGERRGHPMFSRRQAEGLYKYVYKIRTPETGIMSVMYVYWTLCTR